MADIQYKTNEEIELIRDNCLLVSKTLAMVAEHLKPGSLGTDLDRLAEEVVVDHLFTCSWGQMTS